LAEKIDKYELGRIAAQAKLDMGRSVEELEGNLFELNDTKERILDRVFSINVNGVESPQNAKIINTFREDIAMPPLPRSGVLANAGKNTEAGCISVPKILEKGE